jgi:hypothetical protein
MENHNIYVLNCTNQQIDELTDFIYKLNSTLEHSSTFCSKSKSAISEDIFEGISHNSMLACWD